MYIPCIMKKGPYARFWSGILVNSAPFPDLESFLYLLYDIISIYSYLFTKVESREGKYEESEMFCKMGKY